MAALRSLDAEPDFYVPPGHGEPDPDPFAGSSHTYSDEEWEAARDTYGDTLAAVVLNDLEMEF